MLIVMRMRRWSEWSAVLVSHCVLLSRLILTADKHHNPKGQVKIRNSILPAPITDLIKTRNNLRRTKPTDPNLKQLNDDITKRTSNHKTNLWKDQLEQNWDHKQNTHTYWNTLNRHNNKKSPKQTNKNITHTESNRLQQTILKHCKTCYQKNKQESRQIDKETTLRTHPHLQPPNSTSHKRHQIQQLNWT